MVAYSDAVLCALFVVFVAAPVAAALSLGKAHGRVHAEVARMEHHLE